MARRAAPAAGRDRADATRARDPAQPVAGDVPICVVVGAVAAAECLFVAWLVLA